MRNISLVHIIQCEHDLVDTLTGLLFTELVNFFNLAHKVATRQKLHHNVEVFCIFHQLENSGDVRVVTPLQHSQFIAHEVHVDFIFVEFAFLNDFDGAGYLCLHIFCSVDASKRSLAEFFAELVVILEFVDPFE